MSFEKAAGLPFCMITLLLQKFHFLLLIFNFVLSFVRSSRGRVVKAFDSKSNGLCPRRFESCRLRNLFFFLFFISVLILFFKMNYWEIKQTFWFFFPGKKNERDKEISDSSVLLLRFQATIMYLLFGQPMAHTLSFDAILKSFHS